MTAVSRKFSMSPVPNDGVGSDRTLSTTKGRRGSMPTASRQVSRIPTEDESLSLSEDDYGGRYDNRKLSMLDGGPGQFADMMASALNDHFGSKTAQQMMEEKSQKTGAMAAAAQKARPRQNDLLLGSCSISQHILSLSESALPGVRPTGLSLRTGVGMLDRRNGLRRMESDPNVALNFGHELAALASQSLPKQQRIRTLDPRDLAAPLPGLEGKLNGQYPRGFSPELARRTSNDSPTGGSPPLPRSTRRRGGSLSDAETRPGDSGGPQAATGVVEPSGPRRHRNPSSHKSPQPVCFDDANRFAPAKVVCPSEFKRMVFSEKIGKAPEDLDYREVSVRFVSVGEILDTMPMGSHAEARVTAGPGPSGRGRVFSSGKDVMFIPNKGQGNIKVTDDLLGRMELKNFCELCPDWLQMAGRKGKPCRPTRL